MNFVDMTEGPAGALVVSKSYSSILRWDKAMADVHAPRYSASAELSAMMDWPRLHVFNTWPPQTSPPPDTDLRPARSMSHMPSSVQVRLTIPMPAVDSSAELLSSPASEKIRGAKRRGAKRRFLVNPPYFNTILQILPEFS